MTQVVTCEKPIESGSSGGSVCTQKSHDKKNITLVIILKSTFETH